MAKSRFRRKSYRKKTKTARRQKRKSRRMRGGEVLDKSRLMAWAKNNPKCNLKVSAPGFTNDEKILKAQDVIDVINAGGNEFDVRNKVGLGRPYEPKDIVFESQCDYKPNYGEYSTI